MSDYFVGSYPIEAVQKKMFEILEQVDLVCRRNNIRYVLDSGTLLGAVRHKGFIPWDDDIDIAMLREDYEKFCAVANKELPANFVFETMDSRKNYPNIFGKCYNIATVYKQESSAHLDIQHGIFLDIFPMDNVLPKDKVRQCRTVASLNTVRCLKQKTEKFYPRHVLYLPLMLLPIRTLNRIVERQMKKHANENTEFVCPVCQSGTAKPMFRREMFTDTVEVDFEDKKFPIPKNFLEYLHGYYASPMELPPEEKRSPSHGIKEIKL